MLPSVAMMNVPTTPTNLVPKANKGCTCTAHLYADGLDDTYFVTFIIPYVLRDVVIRRIAIVIFRLGPGRDYCLCY